MTFYFHPRRPIVEARKYDPAYSESSAASLETWVATWYPSTVTAVVDSEGFEITTVHSFDGTHVFTGVVGDWIVADSSGPLVMNDHQIQRAFELVP